MRKCFVRRAFAAPDLVAVLVVIMLVAALAVVMGDRARRTARLNEDLSNLRRIGTLTRSYGADFNDLVWAFSWRQGNYTTHWPDMQGSTTDPFVHASRQAVAIMREKGGGDMSTMSVPSGWIPHIAYSHLPLLDYSGEALPSTLFISAADRHRLSWAVHRECAEPSTITCTGCRPDSSFSFLYRWRFSASYFMPTAFYDRAPPQGRLFPWLSFHSVGFNSISQVELHGFRLSDIHHPSGKVMVHELFTRHFGTRQPVYLLEEARIPLLLSDGSADVRRSSQANPGAHPQFWGSGGAPQIAYDPAGCWEPPKLSPSDVGPGSYRWTRMGIRGRDFGGPEIWP
jgi:hypothetical protein